jgi:hypothetical protein
LEYDTVLASGRKYHLTTIRDDPDIKKGPGITYLEAYQTVLIAFLKQLVSEGFCTPRLLMVVGKLWTAYLSHLQPTEFQLQFFLKSESPIKRDTLKKQRAPSTKSIRYREEFSLERVSSGLPKLHLLLREPITPFDLLK